MNSKANYSSTSGTDDWLLVLAEIFSQDHNWENRQNQSAQQNKDTSIIVTVTGTRGSTPRESGTKMLVMSERCVGTIGGGHLEQKVIEMARLMLTTTDTDTTDTEKPIHQFHRIPLGASLGQCCGGHVEILLERIQHRDLHWLEDAIRLRNGGIRSIMVTPLITTDAPAASTKRLLVTQDQHFGSINDPAQDEGIIARARSMLASSQTLPPQRHDNYLFDPLIPAPMQIVIFGAGHVGQAVCNVLQSSPCRIRWIDSRVEMFAEIPPSAATTCVVADDPVSEVDQIPANSYVLIMTHSHQLDLALCEKVLKRGDMSFCGLIGSATKKQRFLRRLTARGLQVDELAQLICPIGIDSIRGKHPGQIAIATAAQIIQHFEKKNTRSCDNLLEVNPH
ncbi:MAG: xanthine dehydrogenase accessory protein XdhC [Granulosicoccus sp.]|nr:xanthine dehydrogenase accessory protein XdhC [Granulosicoccus sp.]